MAVKIAVSGTHSTGKTTFCNELYDIAVGSGIDACLVPESARAVFDERDTKPLTSSRDEIAEIQREIFFKQLVLETEAEAAGHDVVICDRTLMDNIVYARAYGISGGLHKLLYRIAKHHLSTYDHIALTKVNLAVAGQVALDGLRDADLKLWYTIEDGIYKEVAPNTNLNGLRAIVRGIHLRKDGGE